MADALTSQDLRPYRALLLARFEEGKDLSATQVLGKLKKVLGVKVASSGRKVIAAGSSGDPDAAFVRYEDRRQVPWASIRVVDRINHLALVVVKGDWVAIHVTEGSRRGAIAKALERRKLGPMGKVDPGHLKAAFIKGPARTLWLRGTHRSTSSKPDTKVIGGKELEYALDPLGDQSYRYSAIRCDPKNEAIGPVMGLAVDHSRIWVGSSSDWDEFVDSVTASLDALNSTIGQTGEPLPVLAEASVSLEGVEGAYDVSVAPPEILLADPALDLAQAEELAALERLAFGTQILVTEADGASFKAEVLRLDRPLGRLEFEFADNSGQIETSVAGASAPGREEEFEEVLQTARDPDKLTVYYESGHSIQSRQTYISRHRDLPFEGWVWASFADGWEVAREKPEAGIGAVGNGDRSLFSWVCDQWPAGTELGAPGGWLACDDRPGETADFLHIDENGGLPTLTLLHVKGAKSSSPEREIAVVPYETVCAQAEKNVRHLDRTLASEAMLSGDISAELTLLAWKEGVQASREDFLTRLDALGSNFRRRVVVLQPHVRRDLVAEVRAGGSTHPQLSRLRRLDSLLHSAAASCRSVGAEFLVIGSA